jgi:hypothetical protein
MNTPSHKQETAWSATETGGAATIVLLESDPLLDHFLDQFEAHIESVVTADPNPRLSEAVLDQVVMQLCRLSREIGFRIVEMGSDSISGTEAARVLHALGRVDGLLSTVQSHAVQSVRNILERRDHLAKFLKDGE